MCRLPHSFHSHAYALPLATVKFIIFKQTLLLYESFNALAPPCTIFGPPPSLCEKMHPSDTVMFSIPNKQTADLRWQKWQYSTTQSDLRQQHERLPACTAIQNTVHSKKTPERFINLLSGQKPCTAVVLFLSSSPRSNCTLDTLSFSNTNRLSTCFVLLFLPLTILNVKWVFCTEVGILSVVMEGQSVHHWWVPVLLTNDNKLKKNDGRPTEGNGFSVHDCNCHSTGQVPTDPSVCHWWMLTTDGNTPCLCCVCVCSRGRHIIYTCHKCTVCLSELWTVPQMSTLCFKVLILNINQMRDWDSQQSRRRGPFSTDANNHENGFFPRHLLCLLPSGVL